LAYREEEQHQNRIAALDVCTPRVLVAMLRASAGVSGGGAGEARRGLLKALTRGGKLGAVTFEEAPTVRFFMRLLCWLLFGAFLGGRVWGCDTSAVRH